jgi:acetyl-CoA acetyltransferase
VRDVAIVSSAQIQERAISDRSEVEFITPVMNEAKDAVGLTQDDIGFTCSGSSDFLAGQGFSFVMTIDGVGPVPPISESHVEMDGAFALYEAWVKIQTGAADTALVYGYGKSSPGSLRDVLATQLDPYYQAPLWPDAFAIGALQARMMLDAGTVTETRMAEIAAASQAAAVNNPLAVRSGTPTVDELLSAEMLADPLRGHDVPAGADGGVVVVLAAEDRARDLVERPAWIRGIDHRIDSHQIGARNLTESPSLALAASKAGAGSDKIDVAETHGAFTFQQALIESTLGLTDATTVNPGGGPLAGNVMMGAGLQRIADAATAVSNGTADRALAHATSGPAMQQNLVCVLEGDS